MLVADRLASRLRASQVLQLKMDNTLGALYVSNLLSMAATGFVLSEAQEYYTRFPKESVGIPPPSLRRVEKGATIAHAFPAHVASFHSSSRLAFKLSVAVVTFVAVLDTSFFAVWGWDWTIKFYGNPGIMANVHWALFAMMLCFVISVSLSTSLCATVYDGSDDVGLFVGRRRRRSSSLRIGCIACR